MLSTCHRWNNRSGPAVSADGPKFEKNDIHYHHRSGLPSAPVMSASRPRKHRQSQFERVTRKSSVRRPTPGPLCSNAIRFRGFYGIYKQFITGPLAGLVGCTLASASMC
jgi:hypothetical protein